MALYVGITALNRSASVRVPAFTAQQDEVQSVTVDATADTFTLAFRGEETGALAFDISTADLTTALEGLSSIGAGNVTSAGGPGDDGGSTPYTVTFTGELGNEDVEALVADGTSLTGGAGTATVAEDTKGGAGTAVETKLVPGTVSVVDLDDADTRKKLNSHHAIGQWTVVSAHSNYGSDELPENS